MLSSEALSSSGLDIEFIESTLELRIKIPADIRRTNEVYLNGRGLAPQLDDAHRAASLSGYVNWRAAQDFHFNHNDATNGRQPLRNDFDGALNYRDWVLENNASYTANQPHGFSRGDTRLVRDDPKRMIRYAAGDLSYPTSPFQRFRPMAGITVASNFSLQPYRVTVPMSNTEILLKLPSKVVIYVNGYQAQVLQLPAGRHDLRNLALGNGINYIRLEITDALGRVEVVELPWVSDSDLLAPKLHQFAYSLGLPSRQVDNRREYDERLFTASVFHRYGLNQRTTIGANAQGDRRQLVGGLELLNSNTWGTVGLEPAVSRLNENAPQALGYAGRLRYLYTDYYGPRSSQRNFLLGAEYRAARFAQLDDLAPNVVPAVLLSAGYSQLVGWDVSARLGGSFGLNRKNLPDVRNSYNASLALVKAWSTGLQTSLSLTRQSNQTGLREDSLFALVSWVIPESRHYLNLSHDTARENTRAEWRYNSPQQVGGANAMAAYERMPSTHRGDLGFDYTGNRGIISATHNITANTAPNQNTPQFSAGTQQTASLRVGTALVFAGGRISISRPVFDSFAIVAATEATAGQTIDVNPNGNNLSDARSDWLGPAVIPTLRSYQYFHLYLDPSKLEPGFDLGRENYVLLPSYRSGTLIRAGNDAAVMLSGLLLGEQGAPLALASGEARLKGDPKARPIGFFTNRKGKFRTEGFKPGLYELSFYSEGLAPIEVVIPERARGIYDVGKLKANKLK